MKEIKSEDLVCIELTKWLLLNGGKVLQDKKRNNNIPTFKVKGESREKPDLIYINTFTTVIEVKTGEDGNVLGKKSKIIKYFENYCDNKTKYFDENDDILLIDNFVLATKYSSLGRLKNYEELHIDSEKRKYWIEMGYSPLVEYSDTFNIVRRGIWDNIKKDNYRDYNIGVGILLSTKLGYKKDSYNWKNFLHNGKSPAIQIMKIMPSSKTKSGKRWGQQWKPI